MNKRHLYVLFFLAVTGYIFFAIATIEPVQFKNLETERNGVSAPFELRSGDILVRSNWGWLPGSCDIQPGRKFGHVAIVTEGATGNTPDEALEKAMVVEAIIYDQATGRLELHKKDQIRNCKAAISFGPKFMGIRYRLRTALLESQVKAIRLFLVNQLDGGYNIFSQKKQFGSKIEKQNALSQMKHESWHCATLAWEAYYLNAGIDIDANEGYFVYPNDILASKYFDLPNGRIQF
jgi:hypothetical protein